MLLLLTQDTQTHLVGLQKGISCLNSDMDISGTEGFSVAIVGAGIAGLSSALHILKTARRVGREVKVVLYDRNPGPGGTWSSAS